MRPPRTAQILGARASSRDMSNAVTARASEARFNYRVVGVCIQDGHVLAHMDERDSFYSLPGGRIEKMEASEAALRREMREELGVAVKVERLVWVVENFFTYQAVDVHELAFYYLFSLGDMARRFPVGRPFTCLDEAQLRFEWLPLAALGTTRLLPSFLCTGLLTLPPNITHIVHVE